MLVSVSEKHGERRIEMTKRDEGEFQFVYSNTDLDLRYISHVCHMENTTLTKKLLFATPTKLYYRDPWIKTT